MSAPPQPQREAIPLSTACLVPRGQRRQRQDAVITHKIAHLINECGISPATSPPSPSTNKAAKEMRERVAHIMGGRVPGGLTVCTFHALGVRIIRQESRALRAEAAVLHPRRLRHRADRLGRHRRQATGHRQADAVADLVVEETR